MPTYYYKFEDNTMVERRQSIHDDAFETLPHPKTGRYEPVRRVIKNASAVFRGEGWARKK
jgi:predicted nucleic acid-binding Zn ribbon protein